MLAPPPQINPAYFLYSKHPVHQASAQYGEKWSYMVECPWVLAWDTTVWKRNKQGSIWCTKYLLQNVIHDQGANLSWMGGAHLIRLIWEGGGNIWGSMLWWCMALWPKHLVLELATMQQLYNLHPVVKLLSTFNCTRQLCISFFISILCMCAHLPQGY